MHIFYLYNQCLASTRFLQAGEGTHLTLAKTIYHVGCWSFSLPRYATLVTTMRGSWFDPLFVSSALLACEDHGIAGLATAATDVLSFLLASSRDGRRGSWIAHAQLWIFVDQIVTTRIHNSGGISWYMCVCVCVEAKTRKSARYSMR